MDSGTHRHCDWLSVEPFSNSSDTVDQNLLIRTYHITTPFAQKFYAVLVLLKRRSSRNWRWCFITLRHKQWQTFLLEPLVQGVIHIWCLDIMAWWSLSVNNWALYWCQPRSTQWVGAQNRTTCICNNRRATHWQKHGVVPHTNDQTLWATW